MISNFQMISMHQKCIKNASKSNHKKIKTSNVLLMVMKIAKSLGNVSTKRKQLRNFRIY